MNFKQVLNTIGSVLVSTILLFCLLEGAARCLGGVTGASRFAERIILREQLTPQKTPGEFRIFTFGESTIHGSHYAPISSPARWLEKYLHDFLPGRKIRVVNFFRMGQRSSFAYETFKDTVVYQPDLIILYFGHNGYLPGNRKAEVEKKKKSFNYRLEALEKKSVLASAIYQQVIRWRMHLHRGCREDSMGFKTMEAPPLRYGPNDMTVRDSPSYREGLEFFRGNLEKITGLARQKKIKILILRPVSNLKDFSPWYSFHRQTLTAEKLSRWERFYREGQADEEKGKPGPALKNYLRAHPLDSTYAELSFRLGRMYLKNGEFARAKKYFREAKDNDGVIFRATQEVLDTLETFAQKENLALLDTEKWLLENEPTGILGNPTIEDNAHFSLKGQALVGKHLALEIARRNWIAPRRLWRFDKKRPYSAIAEELGVNNELLFTAYLKMAQYFSTRYERRLYWIRKALEIRPEDPHALRHLAWTYWLMGEKEKALKVYAELGKSNPEVFGEVFTNIGELGKAAENYGAEQLLDTLTETNRRIGFSGRPK